MQIPDRPIEPAPSPHLPCLLPDARDIPELPQRGVARVVRIHPGRAVVLNQQLEMQPHFLGHLGFDPAAPHQRFQP